MNKLIVLAVIFWDCGIGHKVCDRASMVPMARIFSSWDLATQNALVKDVWDGPDAKSKSLTYIKSLKAGGSDSIDFFIEPHS